MPLVTFQPEGKTIAVPAGTALLEAARSAGIEIVAPCGTRGNCGKCLVRVISGNLQTNSSTLSESIRLAGYVQACQSAVQQEDLVIDIPPQHIRSGQFADLSLDLDRIEDYLLPQPSQLNPLTVTVVLDMAGTDPEDDLSDAERLTHAIQKQWGKEEVRFSLTALQKMALAMRADPGRVTVKLSRFGDHNQVIDILPGHRFTDDCGLAVDVGTTTVSVQLVSLIRGEIIDTRTDYNGQIACGLDIISRINYAGKPENLARLKSLVLETINRLIAGLVKEHQLVATDIANLALSGNTTMVHLLLGLLPEYIRLFPYTPTILQPPAFRASEIGIPVHPETPVHIAPAVGSYVGGDITAGLLCTSIAGESDETVMFIDIGTNGELVVGNAEFILACACSAGPAFEGGGIRQGMRATRGAIEAVTIDAASGTAQAKTIGDSNPRGICGSGMISLLAGLLRSGWMDSAGKLNREKPSPAIRLEKRQACYVVHPADDDQQEILISEADIENIVRAKAAIYSAISLLTRQAEIRMDEIARVYIAGGFGHYLNLEDAITIGLLPDIPRETYRYIGNASLLGSTMALVSRDFQQKQREIGRRVTYLELSTDPTYMDQYTAALFLPHTDLAAFPSVEIRK
ncbi:DUF4445 domain-containing protein [bacterium]|nr:DUF4445 domain-containing protein [bacterium]